MYRVVVDNGKKAMAALETTSGCTGAGLGGSWLQVDSELVRLSLQVGHSAMECRPQRSSVAQRKQVFRSSTEPQSRTLQRRAASVDLNAAHGGGQHGAVSLKTGDVFAKDTSVVKEKHV